MDDEPMWAADRVVARTPGFAITNPKTPNEFAIKVNHLTLVKGNQFDERIKTDPHDVRVVKTSRCDDLCKYLLGHERITRTHSLFNIPLRQRISKMHTQFMLKAKSAALDESIKLNICSLTIHQSLSNIWIGSFHLFVTVAKYQRQNSVDSNKPDLLHQNYFPKTTKPAFTNKPNGKPSFASVVHGYISTGDSPNIRSISLKDQDLVSIDDSSRVLLVKLKEVDSMSNMFQICRNEGFENLKIHRVGGLWIWILFPSSTSRTSFQDNECMKSLSSAFKIVSPFFRVDERLIWIEINSLPLCGWGSAAFKKVASMFGKFMFFETEQSVAICMGRVCVATKSHQLVSEKFRVEIRGEMFDFHVQEIVDDLDDLLNDLNDGQKEVYSDDNNELTNDKIDNHNMEDTKNAQHQSPKDTISHNFSRPPGFEDYKKGASSTNNCSTSFAKFRKKDIKGFSLINEMTGIIKVGDSQGYDIGSILKKLFEDGVVKLSDMMENPMKLVDEISGELGEIRGCESKKRRKDQDRASSSDRDRGHVYDRDRDRLPLAQALILRRSRDRVRHQDYGGECWSNLDGLWVRVNSMYDKKHAFNLSYFPVENHAAEYFCDICESSLDPTNRFFYHCNDCDRSMHLACAPMMFHWETPFRGRFSRDVNNGSFMLFGDLNEVRFDFERLRSSFSQSEADTFNTFITNFGLIELPLGCHLFTWMNKAGTKLSKLDRFLFSENVIKALFDVQVTALDKLDHNPILLHCNKSDYELLEKDVSMEEIKAAVWDCGNDKAGRSNGFIRRYWEHIKSDIKKFVSKFLETKKMSMDSNSSFITLILKVSNPIHVKNYHPISLINVYYKIIAKILANRLVKVVDKIVSQEQSTFILGRQILDGPLMLREMIDWTSILVNGSPTSEFSVKRGLRQRGSLSPFLFILIMEGLHTTLMEATNSGLICDWSSFDMDNIIRVLQVFYLASGLKINIHKSNVYGVGVSDNENARLVEPCTPETVLVQLGLLKTRYLFLNPLKTMHGVQGMATWLMAHIVKDVLFVGNKMHKAFPLPGESSHWQYKFPLPVEGVPTARRIEIPLLGVCTAMMKKLPVKDRWQLH
nr:RNA-directed DNA polymerase, eukaryota [Tanacetum cinerariifolium]